MTGLDLGPKIGPLPAGAWVAVIGGALFIGMRSRSAGTDTTASIPGAAATDEVPAVDNGAFWGGGGGGLPGLPWPTTPGTTTPVPTTSAVPGVAHPPAWWLHTCRRGHVDQQVASLAKRLNVPLRVTFDADLENRVKYVQMKHRLPITGVVDARTAIAIG